jgi:hypothetical protein
MYIYIYIYIYIQVSQEECARLREGVPYVKVHRYNPKHPGPKLNGYGDNWQRKVWASGGSANCTCQLTVLSMSVLECGVIRRSIHVQYCAIVFLERQNTYATIQTSLLLLLSPSWCVPKTALQLVEDTLNHYCVMYSAWNTKDNYDMSASVFVVQFNGFMSLTS